MKSDQIIPNHVWEKVMRRTNVPAASRSEFERALRHYKRSLKHNAETPSNTDLKEEISKAQKALKSFRQKINLLGKEALNALAPDGCTYDRPEGVIAEIIEWIDSIDHFLSDGIGRIGNSAPQACATRKQRDLEETRWYVRSLAYLLSKHDGKPLTAPEGKAPDWVLELCRLADPNVRPGTIDGAVTYYLEHRAQWQEDCERWEASRRGKTAERL